MFDNKAVALLVLYNPDLDYVASNVVQLNNFGVDVVIYDNTEKEYDRTLLKKLSKRFYSNGENVGLSSAFNLILSESKDKYDYFAFFDQDSKIDGMVFSKLIDDIKSLSLHRKVGIVAAQPMISNQLSYRNSMIKRITNEIVEVQFVPSSYSVITRSLVEEIGFFQEDFFIDFIDYDYSLRARDAGYGVFVDTSAQFLHDIGNGSIFFFNKYLSPITSPYRHYYQIRNALTSHKRRKAGIKIYIKTVIRRLVSITINSLFDIKTAPSRYYYFFKGIYHFLNGSMGKLR